MKFERILIAEDQDVANLSLRLTLEALQLPPAQHAYYCEHALNFLTKAVGEQQPYDLLITDLYFEAKDGKQLPDGQALINSAKAQQPGLKILVFSAENRPALIRSLYEDLHIDGFVRKARGDAQELKSAIEHLEDGRRYYTREFRSLAAPQNQHTFTDHDKAVIRLIAEGVPLKDIPAWLETNEMRPSGLSSIEKRLNAIRTAMGFTKNEQLVIFCRDMGLI
jgi:DNA-binding NarL/FixJ family response regulator